MTGFERLDAAFAGAKVIEEGKMNRDAAKGGKHRAGRKDEEGREKWKESRNTAASSSI